MEQNSELKGSLKIKTQLSYSPGKAKKGVYVVKARLGKKQSGCLPNEQQNKK